MRFLMTGSSGFIGRKILKELLRKNDKVTILLRENANIKFDFDLENVKKIFIDDLFTKDVDWWLDILREIDAVIHAAWYVLPSDYLNSKKNLQCLNGSINMLKAMNLLKVNYFVGLGTCYEYDFSFSNNILKTSTPLKPKSPYTISKVALLNYLKLLESTSNFKFAWCRVFYLYGEGEDKRRLIPYIHDNLKKSKKVKIKNGNYIRDYLDVKTASKLIAKIANERFHGEFNICSGKGETIKNIALSIAAKYNKKHLIEFDELKEIQNQPTKIIGEPFINYSNKI